MANFSNVVGGSTMVFNSSMGKLRVPILELDVPVNTSLTWGINSGTSPVSISVEMSLLVGHPKGTTTRSFVNNAGDVITMDGGARITRQGDNYIFSVGTIQVTSGAGTTSTWNEGSAPFTIVRGSNGIYALFGGSWGGTDAATEQGGLTTILLPSENRPGYLLFIGACRSGRGGILAGGVVNQTALDTFNAWVADNGQPETTDPYDPGGESGTGGGTGTFDGTGDDIDIPSLPTLSATDTGFITLFNPSAGELRSLANYMWSNPLFDLDAWKKIFADPMDAVLGLSIVPVAVPNGGSSSVTVGNISTGVSMTKAGAQYVSVDCGTLNIEEYWGAYLDYDPYTKAEIYLPYIGTHPLAVDDIMGKPVHVVYHVDILSGACCAYVKCGGSVLYSFVGQCSCSIPITGNDWTNVVNGALSIAASIGTMVATGGATAPMAAATIASSAVNSLKPNVEKSGSMGGMGGMLGVQTPYMILTRPRQALPAYQNKFSGYPSFITRRLSNLSGYTEIEEIHLENVHATEQELSEIVTLLKGGVIL